MHHITKKKLSGVTQKTKSLNPTEELLAHKELLRQNAFEHVSIDKRSLTIRGVSFGRLNDIFDDTIRNSVKEVRELKQKNRQDK